jgi:hypothetical protein
MLLLMGSGPWMDAHLMRCGATEATVLLGNLVLGLIDLPWWLPCVEVFQLQQIRHCTNP